MGPNPWTSRDIVAMIICTSIALAASNNFLLEVGTFFLFVGDLGIDLRCRAIVAATMTANRGISLCLWHLMYAKT